MIQACATNQATDRARENADGAKAPDIPPESIVHVLFEDKRVPCCVSRNHPHIVRPRGVDAVRSSLVSLFLTNCECLGPFNQSSEPRMIPRLRDRVQLS